MGKDGGWIHQGFEEMTVPMPIRKSGSLWSRGVAKLLNFI